VLVLLLVALGLCRLFGVAGARAGAGAAARAVVVSARAAAAASTASARTVAALCTNRLGVVEPGAPRSRRPSYAKSPSRDCSRRLRRPCERRCVIIIWPAAFPGAPMDSACASLRVSNAICCVLWHVCRLLLLPITNPVKSYRSASKVRIITCHPIAINTGYRTAMCGASTAQLTRASCCARMHAMHR